MSIRAKIEIVIAILLVVAGVLGFRTWLSEHDLRMQAESKAAAQKQVFDQAADQIKTLQEADKTRDAASAVTIAAIQAGAAKQITPAEIAAWLPKQDSGLPQPITVQLPPATAQNPTPNAIASIPEADLAPLRDQITKCQTCAVALETAQGDAASKATQLKEAGEELSAVSKERDDWKTAAKGGTFWTRTKRAAKWIGIGGGIALGVLCGTGHCKR